MSDDFEPADSVSGASLTDFLDRELAKQESAPPATDVVVVEVLQRAYVESNGWSAVKVTDTFGREFTLSAPTVEGLAAALQRFYNLR